MGSRLLPLVLALAALVADVTSHHRVASYAVLLAVVGAAAAAFVGVGSLLEGKGSIVQAVTTVLALVLLLTGSVVRASAPVGGHVPTLALSTLVFAGLVYAVPLLGWLLEPLVPRARPAREMRPAIR
jgi:hypothetical protein